MRVGLSPFRVFFYPNRGYPNRAEIQAQIVRFSGIYTQIVPKSRLFLQQKREKRDAREIDLGQVSKYDRVVSGPDIWTKQKNLAISAGSNH